MSARLQYMLKHGCTMTYPATPLKVVIDPPPEIPSMLCFAKKVEQKP